MALLIQAVYSIIFKYFCVPVFLLMLVGRPRFLIGWVHKLINAREPFFKLRLFRFTFFLCCLTVVYSYFKKYELENIVENLSKEQAKGAGNIHYIDEKLREAHLFERNTYMFFTFIVIMIIVISSMFMSTVLLLLLSLLLSVVIIVVIIIIITMSSIIMIITTIMCR